MIDKNAIICEKLFIIIHRQMEMRVKYLNTYNLRNSMLFSLTPIIMFILLIWEITGFPKKQGTATILLLNKCLIFTLLL